MKSIVDILVAFDQGAKAKCVELGFDDMDDFADYAVGKMNTVLANSQLDDQFCYRLAGVVGIDGSWSAINNELLLSMRTREGKFAKLPSRVRMLSSSSLLIADHAPSISTTPARR